MRIDPRIILPAVLALVSPTGLAAQFSVPAAGHTGHAAIVVPSLLVEGEAQADSALRAAKRVLDDQNFRDAARMFEQLAERYPRSAQAAEALYWRAFALFRTGSTSSLSSGLAALEDLNRLYPASAANRNDAGSLRIRICGELARRGDERCAQEVARSAAAPTGASAGSGTSQGSTARSCPSEDDDNDERIMALNALMHMNSEAAVPILERTLARRDECSVGLRKKAIFILSTRRSDGIADILLKTAKEDPAPSVREQAIFWLGNVREPRVVDLLADLAANDADAAIQEKAIFALANTRSDRAAQILRDIAQRDGASKGAREQAIFWLGNRRDSSATAFLRDLYGRLTDRDLKERVLFSVANQRSTNSGAWLIGIAMNEREPVELRKQALFHAGNQRAASVGEIATLYDRVADREMKEQIIFVLAQNRADAAVDKLMDIARRDTDRDMRSRAIFWLGQSRDPRVLKFLEEVINR